MTNEEIKKIVDDERVEQLTVQACHHWEIATQRLDELTKELDAKVDTCVEAEIYAAQMRMQSAGIIAYLLEGRKETERAIKFAVWYAERCLHYQLLIYGDKIDALHNSTLSPQASKGNIRYLDVLPKEFTKEDLVNLRLANNESAVVKTIIYRWVKEGKIVKINTNLWQKC